MSAAYPLPRDESAPRAAVGISPAAPSASDSVAPPATTEGTAVIPPCPPLVPGRLAEFAAGLLTLPDEAPGPGPEAPPAVPGYEIIGLLGGGGMGIVYQARHLALRRIVALNRIRSGHDGH